MSIRSYTDEKTGKTLWEVVERPRSSRFPAIRVYKRKKGLKSKAEAIRVQKQVLRDALSELAMKEGLGVPLGKLLEEWEVSVIKMEPQERGLQKVTLTDHVNCVRMYADHLLKRPADQVTRADMRLIFDRMKADGKSKSRQKSFKAAINNVYDWAIENGRLQMDRSPAYGFKLDRGVEKEPEILNINEIRQLLKIARDQKHPWYPIWTMALMTGMRSGELFALTWDDIDWDNRMITVSKSYNRRSREIKSTKSGYWRSVPINIELEKTLKELKVSSGVAVHVLPRLSHWVTGCGAQVLRAFCKGNGLPSIRFHALRACFATQLIRDGIAPAIVMKICGWRDLKTMQRYIRLSGIEIEGATDCLKILPEEAVMGRVMELFST